MRACYEQFGDGILFFGSHARAALTATVLRAERRQSGALDITAMSDGHDHFLTLHEVFVIEPIPACGDFAQTRRGEFGVDGDEFVAQDSV